jgi:hypothetical protein
VACKKSVQNPVQLEMPSPDELFRLLITGNLQTAEVVELADTPSRGGGAERRGGSNPPFRTRNSFRIKGLEACFWLRTVIVQRFNPP